MDRHHSRARSRPVGLRSGSGKLRAGRRRHRSQSGHRDHARTGVSDFAADFQTIRTFAERDNSNIVQWTRHERGGHFAAIEVPELVAADLRQFFTG